MTEVLKKDIPCSAGFNKGNPLQSGTAGPGTEPELSITEKRVISTLERISREEHGFIHWLIIYILMCEMMPVDFPVFKKAFHSLSDKGIIDVIQVRCDTLSVLGELHRY
ncbi:MAG: hypothetical protein ACFFD4_19760 [Candidatus Odinarchaeota archaeon]